ncbi:MAG: type IX secretion system membrane protein PorP/SprF [Flavobacteriales bacterium]|jgi:type IX secretion system PorP/SprF family membrane protein|nr:type IX secretion system membrane protein PorP/SprF [Flavobacteriales bacterium]
MSKLAQHVPALIFSSFFMLLSVFSIKAQDAEFTQFYANPLYLNPAFAGTNKCPRINLNYRNQWPGLSATFVTTSASYDQYVPSISGGLGLMVVTDREAKTLATTRVSGIYAYQLKINRKFSLRAGLEATFFQKSLDWSKLTFGDMIDSRRGFVYDSGDIPRGGTRSGMDFSAGVIGFSEHYFFGFAAHHINQPDESLIKGKSPIPIKLTGHAGAVIPLSGSSSKYSKDEGLSISPNILFRSQGPSNQLNMGMYVNKGPLVGGVWYRNADAFIILLGIHANQIKIGYSYDATISKLSLASGGAHEVSLNYTFKCRPKKRTFRSVTCPEF